MTERLNYGRVDDDDYEDDYQEERGDGYQEDHEEAYEALYYENPDDDYEELDHAAESAQVEPQVNYAADENGISDYANTQFGWRSRARRARRGQIWVPPDTRRFKAPVFLPLADLQSQGDS